MESQCKKTFSLGTFHSSANFEIHSTRRVVAANSFLGIDSGLLLGATLEALYIILQVNLPALGLKNRMYITNP